MPDLDRDLLDRLARLEQAGVRRRLLPLARGPGVRVAGPDGTELRNFASNDYLGLAEHPDLREAAAGAARTQGPGATASRLICGSLPAHAELESALARFKGTEAALGFSTGFAAAFGAIPALVGPGDCVVLDRLAHACLVDAARMSGATLRVFRHNSVEDLERILAWAGNRPRESADGGRVLVVTESVFSMDGDRAPLREIVEAKRRRGAWLMVDEAHATGLMGPGRRGWIEAQGLRGGADVEVTLGTLGKALGSAGGFIAGSAVLIDYLVNRARTFIFSTAPAPPVCAAAVAALRLVEGGEGERRARALWERAAEFHAGVAELGWVLPPPASPIFPLRVGAETAATRLAAALREEGFLVPGIRHPTVARGQARLRVSLSAAHTAEDVAGLLSALRRARDRTGIGPG